MRSQMHFFDDPLDDFVCGLKRFDEDVLLTGDLPVMPCCLPDLLDAPVYIHDVDAFIMPLTPRDLLYIYRKDDKWIYDWILDEKGIGFSVDLINDHTIQYATELIISKHLCQPDMSLSNSGADDTYEYLKNHRRWSKKIDENGRWVG